MPILPVSFARARRNASRLGGGPASMWLLSAAAAALLVVLLLVLGLIADLLVGASADGSLRGHGTGLGPLMERARQGFDRWTVLQTDEGRLLALVLVGMVGIVCWSWLRCWSLRAARRLAEGVAGELRLEVRRQALRVEAAELLCRREIAAAELFTNKAEAVKLGLTAWWTAIPRDVLLLAVLAAFVLLAHPAVGLAAILLASLGWLLLSSQETRARQRQALAADRAWREMLALLDHLRQARLVTGELLDEVPGRPLRQLVEQYRKEAAAEYAAESSTIAWVGTFAGLAAGMATWLLGVSLLRAVPDIGIAEAAVMGAAIACAYRPLVRLRRLPGLIGRADLAAHDIFAYLDRPSRVTLPVNAQPVAPLADKLQLSAVSLSDRAGNKLLDDVSLEVPAGGRVALVSSDPRTPLALACLLPRFEDPQQGEVRFDGADLRQVAVTALRERVALLLRGGHLFAGTVIDNIRCGDARFTKEQVREAAQAAQADEFVNRLPQGFDTILGDHAVQLAQHQVFRIGLARLLLRTPSVVVVEEPEDGQDPATAALTEAAIQALAAGRTTLIVPAHLATLRTADRVFVFHDGKLCAQGTHADLLQNSDLYRHLVYLRFTEVNTGTG